MADATARADPQRRIDAEIAAVVAAASEAALQAGFDFGGANPRAALRTIDAAAVAYCRQQRRTREETGVAWWGFRCGYVAATGRQPWLRHVAEEET